MKLEDMPILISLVVVASSLAPGGCAKPFVVTASDAGGRINGIWGNGTVARAVDPARTRAQCREIHPKEMYPE